MAKSNLYYTQTFTGSEGQSIAAYGRMGDHDHDQSIQFAKDIKVYLIGQGWTGVDAKNFKKKQSKPAYGKEFKWDQSKKKWVKA
jgi:hypothetical protein